ncbi:hypothetical protein SDC9_212482 [bioreactor metagenome]|uniref:Uncharacterized protein n=1 Tax=bioreactor metagenome TaxID=1076179 RepID=A0A645JMU4_9ZZZZ
MAVSRRKIRPIAVDQVDRAFGRSVHQLFREKGMKSSSGAVGCVCRHEGPGRRCDFEDRVKNAAVVLHPERVVFLAAGPGDVEESVNIGPAP